MLVRAIERAGYRPGEEVAISLDIAASEFGRDGRYRLGARRRALDRDGMVEMLLDWLDRYPIVSIEDPFGEDDRDGWIAFTRAAGDARADHRRRLPDHQRRARVEAAARDRACNAVLIKPNQAGTLTETRAALRRGQGGRLRHDRVGALRRDRGRRRSSHLAVGWNAGQLKVGSFARSRADGEMERGAAHRGGARRRGAGWPRRFAAFRDARCGAVRRRMLMPIEELLRARAKDLGGGLMVRRLLPSHPRARRRAVRILRSFRPDHRAARRQLRRAAASAHRPRDRHVSVRRRDAAPRQPGLGPAHRARRHQLDDGGTRHRAFGAHAAGSCAAQPHADARPAAVGGPAASATRRCDAGVRAHAGRGHSRMARRRRRACAC